MARVLSKWWHEDCQSQCSYLNPSSFFELKKENITKICSDETPCSTSIGLHAVHQNETLPQSMFLFQKEKSLHK